ncbi:MAG: hypothetical protein ACREB3_08035 [Burkholderiales bacterium]
MPTGKSLDARIPEEDLERTELWKTIDEALRDPLVLPTLKLVLQALKDLFA